MRNILLCCGVLIVLPALTIINGQLTDNLQENKINVQECTSEFDGLTLCTSTSKIAVGSGETIKLKLSWVNATNTERIIRDGYDFGVLIVDENGEKVLTDFETKENEGKLTDDDYRKSVKSGSRRSPVVEANQTENLELWLTRKYDYKLTKNGKYFVTVTKKVKSRTSEDTFDFTLDKIEIEVK